MGGVRSCPCQNALFASAASCASAGFSEAVQFAAGNCLHLQSVQNSRTRQLGSEVKYVQATGVILQYGLLKVCRDHAVAAHIERTHLSGHYRLLP